MTMWRPLTLITPLPLIIGTTLAGVEPVSSDALLSSSRAADTSRRGGIGDPAYDAVAETYFVPLPEACPRAPGGQIRWDLCQ